MATSTTATDVEATQDVDFACTECGTGYTLTESAIDDWTQRQGTESFDRGAMIRSSLATSSDEWILFDQDGQSVLICPPCVSRLKPLIAAETCPPWCVTDHASEPMSNEWAFGHSAPVANDEHFWIEQWSGSDKLEIEVELRLSMQLGTKAQRDECVTALRAHARKAADAAAWLEAQA